MLKYDSSHRAYAGFCESLRVPTNAKPWKDWFLNEFDGSIDDAAKVSHLTNLYDWLALKS